MAFGRDKDEKLLREILLKLSNLTGGDITFGTIEGTAIEGNDQRVITPIFNRSRLFSYPDGFTWRPFPIIKNAGKWQPRFDITEVINNYSLTKYYVSPTGVNTNNGLTAAVPVKTVDYAVNTLGARHIILLPGTYDRFTLTSINVSGANPLIITAQDPNNTYITTRQSNSSITWTNHSAGVYTFVRSAFNCVTDLLYKDKYGVPMPYLKVNSLAECQSTAGSTYVDGSNNLYVHTFDNRSPDDNLLVLLSVGIALVLTDSATPFVYIEGVKFYGGTVGALSVTCNTSAQATTKLYLNECDFGHNQNTVSGGNGLYNNNLVETYVNNCFSYHVWGDGYNYHTFDGTAIKAKVVEIDCFSFESGRYNTTDINNGSSIHDGGSIIRLNGSYGLNKGPILTDVNTGTLSLNIGVLGYGSLSSTSNAVFYASDSTMWLYDCVADGVTTFRQGGTAILYKDVNTLAIGTGATIGTITNI
jgi:hypothetical protein